MSKHFETFGRVVRDRVTGFDGVVESISFDLYGCVQAIVRPSGVDKDGQTRKGEWFDVKRLEIIDDEPVMPLPDFGIRFAESNENGPAAKPEPRSMPAR